jgi:hypothetical protein
MRGPWHCQCKYHDQATDSPEHYASTTGCKAAESASLRCPVRTCATIICATALQATAARLQDELVARRAELAKVEELPAKVADEMGSISSRLQSLKTDLARISDVPGAQRTAGLCGRCT